MAGGIRTCRVEELRAALVSGDCQLVDVREPSEVRAERLPRATRVPLSAFDRHAHAVDQGRPAYLLCRSGKRAAQAAQRLHALGHPDVRVLEGGIQAWISAGLPVERGSGGVWSLERQVRFVAGSIVFLASLLAALVHPAFVGVTGLVGAGLAFAGLTDSCGMAMVLARMPWKQRDAPPICERS